MSDAKSISVLREPFSDPRFTSDGQSRATVTLGKLTTLWFNTGTLCNIACENCYIESSPENDRLAYLTIEEVMVFLDELKANDFGTQEIGITGGEPFMNPDIIAIMRACLERGFRLLLLTNAMRPMMRPRVQAGLLDLKKAFKEQLTFRVSIDHFHAQIHEQERGAGTWQSMITGIRWLQRNDFVFHIAGRTRWGESEGVLRQGYRNTLHELGVELNCEDPRALVLFPEIDPTAEVPEITKECWDLLGKNPADMMCASSRMIVKHKGASEPAVMACTLLAYESDFNLGSSIADAESCVSLNHPSCAKFCVLGGGSCSD